MYVFEIGRVSSEVKTVVVVTLSSSGANSILEIARQIRDSLSIVYQAKELFDAENTGPLSNVT